MPIFIYYCFVVGPQCEPLARLGPVGKSLVLSLALS